MSRENVEDAKRSWECFVRGDLEGSLTSFDPHAEVHDFPNQPDATVYYGPNGFRRQVEKFTEQMADVQWKPLEFRDCDEAVLVAVQMTGTTVSGFPLALTYFQVRTYREGKVVRMQLYATEAEAREAAGLRE